MQQAGLSDDEVREVRRLEDRHNHKAKKALSEHPLGSWLDDLPGLAGATTAYIVGTIRDPWRFPGQKCEEGHYVRPIFGEGAPCPVEVVDASEDAVGQCGAPLLKPRDGTGVRSLWHYMGLFPGAEKQKGQQTTWNPELKGLCLAPDTGLAAQIVRQKPEPYRTTYDEEKDRLKKERGYNPSDGEAVEADEGLGTEAGSEPPPLAKLDHIARVIAVKEFIGDLLMEWKEVQPLDSY